MSASTSSLINGESTLHDLFVLTDEQILEIEPEAQDAEVKSASSEPQARREEKRDSLAASLPRNDDEEKSSLQLQAATRIESQTIGHGAEPPHWVAEAMNDPQRGREARAFWEGAQKAQQEAAAYREVFAKPEEARSAAERARVLDDIDRAYFAGDANQRTQLAVMMLREDPAAFREMVFEGLRALEKANVAPPLRTASSEAATQASQKDAALPTQSGQAPPGATTAPDAQQAEHAAALARYAAFEKATNEDLERSVGSAIERTLEHALPNSGRADDGPMKGRLAGTIRQDVEKALQGDRQLGEQVAQLLSARRLDNETRTQVVRLIGQRAEQLVPSAAKRALNDWTQTTLAAHRSRSQRTDTTAARKDVSAASAGPNSSPSRTARSKSVDYRKLSDEQILNL